MLNKKELEYKLKQAEKLKQKQGGFLGIGATADFCGSGIIYEEIAEEMSDKDDKEKYYTMAAETFAQDKSEYAHWKASECYRELFEINVKDNREKATEFQMLGLEHLVAIKKWNIAGQRCVLLGELFEIDETEKALNYFTKAVECFTYIEGAYKANLKIVRLKVLLCNIILKRTDDVIKILKEHEKLFERQKLCLHLCLILKNNYTEIVDNDLSNRDERELIDVILNGEKEDFEQKINEFRSDTHLNVYAECIFDMFLESYALENELC